MLLETTHAGIYTGVILKHHCCFFQKIAPDEKAWYLQMEASTWNSKIWTMAVRLYQSQQRSKTSVLAADQRQFRSRTCLTVSSTATWLGSVGFAVSCQRRLMRFGNWMNWMDLRLAWNSAVASRPSKLSLTHTSYKRADLWRTEFLSLFMPSFVWPIIKSV